MKKLFSEFWHPIKVCKCCNKNRSLGQFKKNKRSKDGLENVCLKCKGEACSKNY